MKAGSLPRNWAQAPLSELATVCQGQSPPGSTYNAEGVGLPFLQGSAEFGELSPSPTKWCSEPVRVADQGDILISIRAPVGPTNVADQRYCIGRGLAAIRASHCIEPAFLLHQIRHGVAALVDRATGTTFDAIGGSVLRDHSVVVAPLPEQRRVVEAIDSYLTRLDDAVASLERVQAKLKAYRASVLKAAVEGRLVPTETSLARAEKRPYEPAEALLARILKERRRRWEEAELARLTAAGKTPKDDKWKARYEEPVAPETSTLSNLPEGWCWATVSQVAEHRLGKMLDKDKNRGTPRPYLRNANVRWFTFDLADVSEMRVQDTELDEVTVRAGDVVVCEGGEPGRAAVWQRVDEQFVIQKALHRVRPAPGISPWFFTYVLAAGAASGRLAKGFTGSTIRHFTGEALHKHCVPLPPQDEQERLTEAVEDALSLLAAAEKAVETAQRRSSRLRQAILKWAFEGRLVDQDQTDEPAGQLLARIRDERAADAPVTKNGGRRAKGVA